MWLLLRWHLAAAQSFSSGSRRSQWFDVQRRANCLRTDAILSETLHHLLIVRDPGSITKDSWPRLLYISRCLSARSGFEHQRRCLWGVLLPSCLCYWWLCKLSPLPHRSSAMDQRKAQMQAAGRNDKTQIPWLISPQFLNKDQ